MTQVHVEFLGTPRLYAEVDGMDCDAASISELLGVIAEQFPRLRQHCFRETELRTGFLIGVNSRFDGVVADRVLQSGDRVQFLSADVGGH